MKLTVERQILIAFLLAIVSLGAISAITYQGTETLIDNLHAEKERQEALIVLSEVFALVAEAEIAPRGYVLTGDDAFILQLLDAENEIKPRLERLRTLLSALPGQGERLASLRPEIWAQFDQARRLNDARRQGNTSTRLLKNEIERSRSIATKIRELAEELKAAEYDALQRAASTAEHSAEWLRRFLLLGSIAAVLIVALAGAGVIGEFRRRERAEDALQQANLALKYANDELSQRVEAQSEEMLRKTGEWQSELQQRFLAEQSARREAEMANRLKDEFLATVSHELRAPLNAILGWAKLLRSRRLDEPTTVKALETIERSAESQNRLIEDLLDVSRIIAGKLRIDSRPLAPGLIVRAALETVRPAAETKQITLATEIPDSMPMLAGDFSRLQQVVWNLLSNAVKFTPQGGHVTAALTADESQIEIAVSDDGQGIRPEFLPHVFERFRQADSSSARRHGGLGLGLAIVRHLVEMHGGSVEAQSDGEGCGATFIVRLPVLPAQNSESADGNATRTTLSRPAVPRLPEGMLAGLRILAVDDQEEVRDLLAEILAGYGATVITASSAAEALDAIDREPPDLLVSDLGMPQEDGYSLIQRVRTLDDDRGGRVPAIALTAYAQTTDRLRALDAGFQTHLVKPVEPGELVMTIAALTGRKQTAEHAE
ncbi:MAG: response regulator [Blastocatellales bacterium]|nr:response regulator [Blastocatellales bacterium]